MQGIKESYFMLDRKDGTKPAILKGYVNDRAGRMVDTYEWTASRSGAVGTFEWSFDRCIYHLQGIDLIELYIEV